MWINYYVATPDNFHNLPGSWAHIPSANLDYNKHDFHISRFTYHASRLMRIILTHEQADFDALASLLGAHLLDEDAVPVLPRRMNRNVGAFITLYGAELPFVDPRDLDGEPIRGVTLVDTQSFTSVKGMGRGTKFRVIDHHPLREDTPPEWEVTSEPIGATATLFVEGLRERDTVFGTVAATLLLLGIYEDTGSLTYTRTTPRDLSAAAYLLEHGASLEIAANFLNHPLSTQQQELYDEMRAAAETHHLHGHTIIIACGDAQDMNEELSTVAHKLRDLLDPDALFLLVTTRGGVQLIARSTSDNIDVSEIADHFGGGGHERAAAGLIKDTDLSQVCRELIDILPDHVHPAITVAEIMSSDPQLLSADTPVKEAARRMQRYGYEGYPVVERGKVIGLLTRRAVDRALSHKLNLTAEKLMDAGDCHVYPGDSVERLQRVMTDSGWGQIPVVDPESGEVAGIVTRTDLLKTLSREPKTPGRQNFADRLENALPAARLALLRAVAQVAYEQRCALYIVGGFVRDLLLERPSQDFDLVVEGNAVELARGLAKQYGGRVTSHARFGTAKWHIAEVRPKLRSALAKQNEQKQPPAGDLPDFLDLVTARTEFYTHPSALPTVERGSIKLDLHRRDFTINTLALRLDGPHYGDLHDYWGGLNDLREGLVRVLHSLSFVDDPTRMLRAVRFEQRFGFKIEDRSLELLLEARGLLDRVSGDRVRHELDHILAEERVCAMMARLEELELLGAIHEALTWDEWLCDKFESLPEAASDLPWGLEPDLKGIPVKQGLAYILWLIRLPSDSARAVIARLKIPRVLVDHALAARHLRHDLPDLSGASASQVAGRLDEVPPLAIYAVYIASDDERLRATIQEYLTNWRHVTPNLDGHDLRARGLPPGPIYRHILETLRDAWLDGEITTQEQEAALADQMIAEHAE
jgi:tRNA nucleotidyltransferase (CCA-adding enzyme)